MPSSSPSSSSARPRRQKKKEARNEKFESYYKGQTRADRAKVRQKHREIEDFHKSKKSDIHDVNGQAKIYRDGGDTAFHQVKDKVDKNYENVNQTREFVGDLRNVKELASDVVIGSKTLVDDNKYITRPTLYQGIKERFAENSALANSGQDLKGKAMTINWAKVGEIAGVYFRDVPRWNPMLGKIGTFSTVRQPRKQAQKYVRAKQKKSKAQEKTEDGQMDEQAFQGKLCNDMMRIAKEKCLNQKLHPVTLDVIGTANCEEVRLYKQSTKRAYAERCFFSLILNRESFAQTVENMFACAILARDGKISIGIGRPGDIQNDKRKDVGLEDIRELPCFWCPIGNADAVNAASGGQKELPNIEMVPKLNTAIWESLCEDTDFKGFMPNRKYPEYYGGKIESSKVDKETSEEEEEEEEESGEEEEEDDEEEEESSEEEDSNSEEDESPKKKNNKKRNSGSSSSSNGSRKKSRKK